MEMCDLQVQWRWGTGGRGEAMGTSGEVCGWWQREVDMAFKQIKIKERQWGGERGKRGKKGGGLLPKVLMGEKKVAFTRRRKSFTRETEASLRPTLSPC
jgi:hypothetical protein